MAERRQTKEAEIEELDAEIGAKREQISHLDIDREAADTAEEQLDMLEAAQEECRDIEAAIDHKERTLDDLEQQLADRRDELAGVEKRLEAASLPDETTIQSLEDRRQRVQRVALLLDNLAEVGRAIVDSDHDVDLPTDRQVTTDATVDVTAVFASDSAAITCPLCSNTAQREAILERVGSLESTATEYYDLADEIAEQLVELRSDREHLQTLREEQQNLENDVQRLEYRIEETERRIAELEDTHEDKQTEVDDLRERVEDVKERRSRELEMLYDEIAELQGDRADAETLLERIDAKIAEHESVIANETDLRDERTDLEAAIEERRERVARLERRVQDAAGDHMEELVERLDYAGLEGIRIDRDPVDDPAAFSNFRLVVERRQQSGALVEEDDIGTLSESERSLVGLVVSLAGYVAHEVADEVPFLLLDSIEEFDTDRIDHLLAYVRGAVDVQYVVTALLAEDAEKISAADAEITADTFA